MNKSELIEFMVKNKCCETKVEAEKVVNSFQSTVELAIKEGEEINPTTHPLICSEGLLSMYVCMLQSVLRTSRDL